MKTIRFREALREAMIEEMLNPEQRTAGRCSHRKNGKRWMIRASAPALQEHCSSTLWPLCGVASTKEDIGENNERSG